MNKMPFSSYGMLYFICEYNYINNLNNVLWYAMPENNMYR